MKYKKAIYSYWNPNRNGAGFISINDFLCTFALSVIVSSKHFETIELYTDKWGKELISKLNLPIKINTKLEVLNDIKLAPEFWGYAKIMAYADQSEPFLHIDNDVIMWDGINKNVLNKSFIFQSVENFDEYVCYHDLIKNYANMPVKPIELLDIDWSINFGVFGSDRIDIIKEYKQIVDKYLFSKENQKGLKATAFIREYQNIFFEQYLFLQILAQKNLIGDVGYLLSQNLIGESNNDVNFRYTHLWASTKRDKDIISKVKERLKKENEGLYKLINKININN